MTSDSEVPPKDRITVPDGEPVPVGKGSHVYLIDGSGYIFRAFHALPPLTRPSDGLPVGAVHGFCAMLWKLIQDAKGARGPTHIAVIFDASRTNYRNDIYPELQGQPPARARGAGASVPADPRRGEGVQHRLASSRKATRPTTSSRPTRASRVEAGGDVTVVSSDKDLMQLVKPGVVMLDTMKGKTIGREEVIEKFGLEPACVVDIQALAGDSTDNVPGVPGIGIKTAAELIREYGDLDTLLARAGEIKQPKRREKLIEFAEQARMSRELVRLKQDVPIEVPVDRLGLQEQLPDPLLNFMRHDGIQHADAARRGSARCRRAAAAGTLRRIEPEAERRWSGNGRRRNGQAPGDAGAETPAAAVAYGAAVAREPKVDRAGLRNRARPRAPR